MALLLKNKFIIESCTNAADANSSVTQSLSQAERTFLKKREVYEQCFEVLDKWILSKLKQKRGADIQNFATITWEVYENLNGEKKTRPVFLPKPNFIKSNKILYQSPLVEPTLAPCEEINFTKLAIKFSHTLTKDVVFTAVRDLVRKIGEVCGSGREVNVDFSFGQLHARERKLAFEFSPQALVDKSQGGNQFGTSQTLHRSASSQIRPRSTMSSSRRLQSRHSSGSSRLGSSGSRTLAIRDEVPSLHYQKQGSSSSGNLAMKEQDYTLEAEEPETNEQGLKAESPTTHSAPYRKPEVFFHGGTRPLRKLPSGQHDAGVATLALGSHAIQGEFAPTNLPDTDGVPGLKKVQDPMASYIRATSANTPDRPLEAGFLDKNISSNPIMEAAVQRYIESMRKVAKEEDDLMHQMNENREKDEEELNNRISRMQQRRKELECDIKNQMDEFNMRKKNDHDERRSAATNANFPLPLNAKTRLSLGGGVYSVPFEPPMEMSTGNGGINFGPRRGKGKQIDKMTLQTELKTEIQKRLKEKQDARDQRINEEKRYVDHVLSEHERQLTAQRMKNLKLKNEMVNSLNRDIHMKNLHKLTKLGESPLNTYMQLYARSESVPPGISEKNMFAMSRKIGTASSPMQDTGSIGFDARSGTR
mmetsp:Transcript_16175/g.21419  ORF Transcript_16175/g.21419 Transcript_16175/m.21419 type:complete len:647 (+) Transcript_16175:177-2117(+)